MKLHEIFTLILTIFGCIINTKKKRFVLIFDFTIAIGCAVSYVT